VTKVTIHCKFKRIKKIDRHDILINRSTYNLLQKKTKLEKMDVSLLQKNCITKKKTLTSTVNKIKVLQNMLTVGNK